MQQRLYLISLVLLLINYTCGEEIDTDVEIDDPNIDTAEIDRILHGRVAKPMTFPFQVSLQENTRDRTYKFCGGVIIKPKWILTAAHCYFNEVKNGNKFRNDFRVKAGVVKANDLGPTAQYVPNNSMDSPLYRITFVNDIALLQLKYPLKYNKYVRPIALPPKNYKAKGIGTIVGWGAIDNDEEVSSLALRYATIPVSKKEECDEYFENPLTKNQLCLGVNSKYNACAGDSGGPFVQTIKGKPAVVGITSYGTEGCYEDEPIVYTNVVSHLDFIKKTIIGASEKTNKDIDEKPHPYLVSLLDYDELEESYENFCTGVIIHEKWVLTTADCFDNENKNRVSFMRIKIGSPNPNINVDELLEISKFIRHPLYKIEDKDMKFNVALIKLKESLPSLQSEQKAFLPSNDFDVKSFKGQIIGWHIENSINDIEDNTEYSLATANVTNGDQEECKKYFPNQAESTICVVRTDKTCNFDTSSPLIVPSLFVVSVIKMYAVDIGLLLISTLACVYGVENIDLDKIEFPTDIPNRILNGQIAKARQFPYQVSLQERERNIDSKFCGGVILNANWILTAAHCYAPIGSSFSNDYYIKAGNTKAFEFGDTTQFIEVSRIILHPQYNDDTNINDIALLQLKHPLKFNKYVRPVNLPRKNYDPKNGQIGTIVGWGAIDNAEQISSKVLRYANIPVSPRSACNKYFEPLRKSQICLGYKSKYNACRGDSGGPFLLSINGRHTVVGITSFGTVGCHENDPIVYTNVGSFVDFINSNIKKYSKKSSTDDSNTGSNYSYLASIQEYNDEDESYEKLCTGTIVDERWIFTSADCFDNSGRDRTPFIRVKVGSVDVDDDKKGTFHEILKFVIHPEYNPEDKNVKNNIAMVLLKKPLTLSKTVSKAFLPPSFLDPNTIEGKIVGWSAENSTDDVISHRIVSTEVTNGEPKKCKEMFPNMDETNICLVRIGGNCSPDIGSPLVIEQKNGNIIVGLNSIVDKNCEQDKPFLVTNVHNFANIIDRLMQLVSK
ncbi:uncharacterized protein LOC123301132 [Chrysoperla carnea]|uniref:uncharacterized protein LOC123301132 n=1 Tax=Chrysoperla carnea TaxID=189513 RepID=UPI001D091EB3|nr:uncharacterized protein LOC123301132 [Chrysoperla carnea]